MSVDSQARRARIVTVRVASSTSSEVVGEFPTRLKRPRYVSTEAVALTSSLGLGNDRGTSVGLELGMNLFFPSIHVYYHCFVAAWLVCVRVIPARTFTDATRAPADVDNANEKAWRGRSLKGRGSPGVKRPSRKRRKKPWADRRGNEG